MALSLGCSAMGNLTPSPCWLVPGFSSGAHEESLQSIGTKALPQFIPHHLIIVLLLATLQHYRQDRYNEFFRITSAGCDSSFKDKENKTLDILLVPDTRARRAPRHYCSETATTRPGMAGASFTHPWKRFEALALIKIIRPSLISLNTSRTSANWFLVFLVTFVLSVVTEDAKWPTCIFSLLQKALKRRLKPPSPTLWSLTRSLGHLVQKINDLTSKYPVSTYVDITLHTIIHFSQQGPGVHLLG